METNSFVLHINCFIKSEVLTLRYSIPSYGLVTVRNGMEYRKVTCGYMTILNLVLCIMTKAICYNFLIYFGRFKKKAQPKHNRSDTTQNHPK